MHVLAGIISLVKLRTKQDIFTNPGNSTDWWFTLMKTEVKARVYDRNNNSGIAIVKKAGGLDRLQIRNIIRYHLKKNTKEGTILLHMRYIIYVCKYVCKCVCIYLSM